MNIQQAIERANEMRAGNSASNEMKIRWLSEIDNLIYNDVILTHHTNVEPFKDYEDESQELIAEKPYDKLYVYWLMAQIDLACSELNKYNASLSLFNEALKNYKAWYNRTHMPNPKAQIKLGIDRWC
jgi:hypothetical protein